MPFAIWLIDIQEPGPPTSLASRRWLRAVRRRAERMLPSGTVTLFADRVGSARYYLQRAGMLEPKKRAVYAITGSGLQLLKDVTGRLTTTQLRQRSPELDAWIGGTEAEPTQSAKTDGQAAEQQNTPDESLVAAHATLRRAVESDLLLRRFGPHDGT